MKTAPPALIIQLNNNNKSLSIMLGLFIFLILTTKTTHYKANTFFYHKPTEKTLFFSTFRASPTEFIIATGELFPQLLLPFH